MSDCIETEVRDALPDLIHGRLSDLDTATLTAHVESCADCRAEMDLLRQVRASAPLAPQMDVARIVSTIPLPMPSAADVVASLPSRPKAAPRRSFIWKTASVAALLVVGSLTFANSRHEPVAVTTGKQASMTPVAAPAASPPVAVASAPSQVAVTESVSAAPVKVARPAKTAGLSLTGVQDLTDDQLQALVDGLDNVKALPSAEPEAISIGVDDNEGIQ